MVKEEINVSEMYSPLKISTQDLRVRNFYKILISIGLFVWQQILIFLLLNFGTISKASCKQYKHILCIKHILCYLKWKVNCT